MIDTKRIILNYKNQNCSQMEPEKVQGQAAVNKIIQIRDKFPKANVNDKKELIQQFKDCIFKMVAYLKVQNNPNVIDMLKNKLPELKQQIKAMKAQMQKEQAQEARRAQQMKNQKQQQPKYQPQPQQNQNNNNLGVQPPKKVIKDKQASEIESGLADAIVRQKPNIKWDDVAGLDQAKKVLQEAVILPIKFPEVFVGQRTPWRGILLYGPPGTGKTFLAKACATEMQGGTFFSVSASDLMSKYVGQSEKTLKALFRLAREERPSIIFIDEIDSIAGERSSQENEVSRRVKTQFLIQMQGVGNDCKDVLILGATNLPWALDSAVRRRFEKRVYIPLPDIKGRLAMIKKVAQKNNIELNHEQLIQIAQLTDGYSGSDISNMANDALMTPVRSLDKTRKWLQVNDHGKVKYSPHPSDAPLDPNGIYFDGTMQDLKNKGHTIYLQTTYEHFISALKNSKPSVSQSDLGKYIQFTKTFGMDG